MMGAACGGGGVTANAPSPTPTPAMLTATPQSLAFPLDPAIPPPQTVTLAWSSGTFPGPIAIAVADPTVVGVTPLVFVVATNTPGFAVSPIAHGSTTVTFSSGGASATITAASAVCGRPDFLRPESQLVYPRPNSTGNTPTVGRLYFAVWTSGQSGTLPEVRLHLIVGEHGTDDEPLPLQVAVPPPGSAPVTPVPNATLTYMSSTTPPLQAATTYRTQLYDDACQPALLTGSFST